MRYLNLDFYKRMTVRPPGVQELDPALDLRHDESGRRLIRGPRPTWWRFAMPPDPDRDARSEHFRRVRDDSLVLPTETVANACLDAALPMTTLLVDAAETSRDPVTLSEADTWSKLTIQRGVDIAWYVPPLAPGLSDLQLPEGLHKAMRIVARAYKQAWLRLSPSQRSEGRPDPSTTNSGFPLFTSHPAAKVASACLYSPSYDTMRAHAEQWCRDSGLPTEFALGNGLGGRSGPSYKWRPEYSLEPGYWHASTEYRGHQQRNRIVQMAPLCVNMYLRNFYHNLHNTRKTMIGLWRTKDEDLLMHTGRLFHYEADVSGFDTGVTPVLQAAVASALVAEWHEMEFDILGWFRCEHHALIAPDMMRNPLYCSALVSAGGVSSGVKPTSEIGTFIVAALSVFAMMEQGINVSDWPNLRREDVWISHQGDDIRLSSMFEINESKWTASFSKVGLKCELRPGFVFLARHLFPGGFAAPLAGRLVQQTFSNEHEPFGRAARGLLFLGFAARFAEWHNVPSHMKSAVWDVIRHVAWIEETKAVSVDHLLAIIAGETAQKEIRYALALKSSQPWLLQQYRDAAHSPSAAVLISLAQERGLNVVELLSQDHMLEKIIWRVAAQPLRIRHRLLADLTSAVGAGARALDVKWASILSEYA